MSVSEEVLNNMGSLEGLISSREYTTGVVPMRGETVVRNEFDPTAPPISAQNPYATPGGVPQSGESGVVPQFTPPAQPVQQPVAQPPPVSRQPQISAEQYQAAMAYADRMREQAEASALAQQDAEDNLFLESIAHLSQVEQDREILLRYNKQLESAFVADQETKREREAREEAEEQEIAKETVAWKLATQNGLPWGNEGIRAALLASPDRRTMDAIIAGLTSLSPAQQVAATQAMVPAAAPTPAQVAAQQLVAAPPRGGGSAPPQRVRTGSGDIAGLIKAKTYQAINS